MAKSSDSSPHEHTRILAEQWRYVERPVEGTTHTANRLPADLAMEALDHRESFSLRFVPIRLWPPIVGPARPMSGR